MGMETGCLAGARMLDPAAAKYEVSMYSDADDGEGIGNVRPAYSLDCWNGNNCPSFIQAFRFGGGAGIWDPNIGPSQDTDTSDPQQHRHHQWIHTPVHRARLDQGIASRPALPTTRQLTQGDPATGATWTKMCFAGPSAHTHSETAPTPPILDQRAGQPPRPHGERRPDRRRWVRSVVVYRAPSADSVHRFGVRYIRGRRRSARRILPAR
jgi:hypothetical protein